MQAVLRFCIAAGMGLWLTASTHGASVVFQADFQASTVESGTAVTNPNAGTAIGSWLYVATTNNNIFADSTGTQLAFCPDTNFNLFAVFASPLALKSNAVVSLHTARGRAGSTGTSKSYKIVGTDDLGNPCFDLEIFANQDQAAGTNGALYWNNAGNYTNWFGTNYSLAGDIRNFTEAPDGYLTNNMSALRIELFETGYIVHLEKSLTGVDTWVSTLLPYNGSPTTISRISFQGGPGSAAWLDDIVVRRTGTLPPPAFTPTASMSTPRFRFTSTRLPNGTVLSAGGMTSANGLITNSAEIYDPATGLWTLTGSLNDARYQHTETLLTNGLVLVTGGSNNTQLGLVSCELFNPATGTWTNTGPLAVARGLHSATLLQDGTVLVVGGRGSGGGAQASAEVYNPASGTWTTVGSLFAKRWNHEAILLPDGRVLVAGGWAARPLGSVELYDPVAQSWTQISSLSTNRDLPGSVLLPAGQAMVASGTYGGAGGQLANAEIFDPATGAWTLTQNMSYARYAHTLTLLANGQVLIVGGTVDASSSLASAEIYNPVKGTWTQTASLNTPRRQHTTTVLKNGLVLVAGGASGTNHLASAELYAPPQAAPFALQKPQRLPNGSLQLSFTNAPNLPFSVLSAPTCSPPSTNWTVLGSPTEVSAGRYQFTNSITNVQRFYRIRSP